MFDLMYGFILLLLLMIIFFGKNERKLDALIISLFFAKDIPFIGIGERVIAFDAFLLLMILIFIYKKEIYLTKSLNGLTKLLVISLFFFCFFVILSALYSFNKGNFIFLYY